MIIQDISLVNYRNYHSLRIKLSEGLNVFIGDNAQGKTNLLEAIYFCVKGKSFKSIAEDDLIRFDQRYAYIGLNIKSDGIEEKIEVKLEREQKKIIRVNETIIPTLRELRKEFPIVLFIPEDLKIIKESPSLRRNLIDDRMIDLQMGYRKKIAAYNRLLLYRNKLLKEKQYTRYFREEIAAYTKRLAEEAQYIIRARREYVKKINILISRIHQELTDGKETLALKYLSNVDFKNPEGEINEQEIYEEMMKALEKDQQVRYSNVGPHKDDIQFLINGRDAKKFASQGQQRTAILAIHLAEIDLLNFYNDEMPLILLDDVFSELDETRRNYILNKISGLQAIITTTDADFIEYQHPSNVVRIKNGAIH